MIGSPVHSLNLRIFDYWYNWISRFKVPIVIAVHKELRDTLESYSLTILEYEGSVYSIVDIAEGRNVIREYALDENYDCVFWIDTDVFPGQNAITRAFSIDDWDVLCNLPHGKFDIGCTFTKREVLSKVTFKPYYQEVVIGEGVVFGIEARLLGFKVVTKKSLFPVFHYHPQSKGSSLETSVVKIKETKVREPIMKWDVYWDYFSSEDPIREFKYSL